MKARRSTIVFAGTPGAGKTSVARLLSSQLGARYLSINQLAYANRLYSEIDQERRTRVLDMNKARSFLKQYMRSGISPVVVDTHVADLVPRGFVRRVIVLRCHPRVLQARLRRKGWRASKIHENVLAEILDSCYTTAADYYGLRKVDQIDTTKLSPDKSARQARKILAKPTRRTRVDWLEVLQLEGQLGKYLR